MSLAVRYFIGAVIAILVALLLAPLIPVAGHIIAILAWIVAAALILYGLYVLLFSGPRATP